MRRLLIPLAVLVILGAQVPVASAASAISLLEPYVVNYLEDDDFEIALPAGADDYSNPLGPDDTLDVGDLLAGFVIIQPFVKSMEGPNAGVERAVVPNGATFTGVFLVSVTSKTADGDDWIYEFGKVSTAQWTALTGFTPTSSDTMAAFWSDTDVGATPAWADPEASPDELAAFATAMDGTLLWEFGFTDAQAAAGDRFWIADAEYDVIGTIGRNSGSLKFNAALDVTAPGAGPDLLPFSLWDVAAQDAFFGIYSDLQIQGRNTATPVNPAPKYFPVFTDSEVYLKPTPEPASLALLGLGLLGLGGVVYRRRRQS